MVGVEARKDAVFLTDGAEEGVELANRPPPPDLNSLASKLTRPAPNFLASATTYSRKRQNNSFQKGKKHCNVNLYPKFLLY